MKPNYWRHALGVMALLPLCLSVYAQTPAPAPAAPPTSGAAAPAATPAPAPLTASTIAADPTITGLTAAAETPEGASRGDTAWMIVASALVMLMTPGLAFFYGGLVRSKNVLNTLMMSFAALGIISIQWMLWGYSVAFGPTRNQSIGDRFVCQPAELDGTCRQVRGPSPVSNAADHSRRDLHAVPDDVRDHHAGPDLRRDRRAHEVWRVLPVHSAVGDVLL